MEQTGRWGRAAKVLRGLVMVMAGVMLLYMAGCGSLGGGSAKNGKTRSDEGQRTVYSGLHYAMVQGQAIHKPSGSDDREYVFIPLTLRNRGNTIVFSSYACVEAYAVPGGIDCKEGQKEALRFGKETIKDFTVFDGMLYAGQDFDGWLAFEVPVGTRSVHVDFHTGCPDEECLSFDCQL